MHTFRSGQRDVDKTGLDRRCQQPANTSYRCNGNSFIWILAPRTALRVEARLGQREVVSFDSGCVRRPIWFQPRIHFGILRRRPMLLPIDLIGLCYHPRRISTEVRNGLQTSRQNGSDRVPSLVVDNNGLRGEMLQLSFRKLALASQAGSCCPRQSGLLSPGLV